MPFTEAERVEIFRVLLLVPIAMYVDAETCSSFVMSIFRSYLLLRGKQEWRVQNL